MEIEGGGDRRWREVEIGGGGGGSSQCKSNYIMKKIVYMIYFN